jgi:hypothetical protein
MHEIAFSDCESIGGGTAASLAGVLISILANATPIREFFDGVFDGYGRI